MTRLNEGSRCWRWPIVSISLPGSVEPRAQLRNLHPENLALPSSTSLQRFFYPYPLLKQLFSLAPSRQYFQVSQRPLPAFAAPSRLDCAERARSVQRPCHLRCPTQCICQARRNSPPDQFLFKIACPPPHPSTPSQQRLLIAYTRPCAVLSTATIILVAFSFKGTCRPIGVALGESMPAKIILPRDISTDARRLNLFCLCSS